MKSIIGKEFSAKVCPLVDQAMYNIDIIVYDWRWYENDPGNPVQLFNQSIVRAVRRGVKVRAIINSELILKILRNVGCDAKRVVSKKLVHAKLIILDQKHVVLGSHNFSQSAFTLNQEVSVYLPDFVDTPRLLTYFNSLFII